MRPLQLELEGFRSYDSAVVDWRPHRLVVIEGATGAGKSTLLDAICFALYGRTAEGGATTRDLLTLGREHGEVRLTFALDGTVWRATRRLGTRAPEPRHILERLAGDGAGPEETIHNEGAVNERLRELLGMSFAAFTSAVVLAQGRFAQFLQASPKERDIILRELFGIASLDHARGAADGARRDAEARAEALAAQRATLDDHRPRERTRRARHLRRSAARLAALRALTRPARRLIRAEAARTDRHRRARELRTAVAGLPPAARMAELATRVEGLNRAVAEAATRMEEARAAERRATAARDEVRARHGGGARELAELSGYADRVEQLATRRVQLAAEYQRLRDGVAAVDADLAPLPALTAHREAHLALEETAKEHARAERELAAAAAAHREATAAFEAAAARAAAAGARRDQAQHLHLAADLRRTLRPGDICPVCQGTVGRRAPAEPDLERARDEAIRAEGARDRARTALTRAETLHGERERALAAAASAHREAEERRAAAAAGTPRARAELDALLERLREREAEGHRLRARLAAVEQDGRSDRQERLRLEERLGAWIEGERVRERLAAAIAEVGAGETRATEAEREAARRRQEHAEARSRLHDLVAGELARVRDAAAVAADRIGHPPPDDGGDPARLMGAVAALAQAGDAATRTAELAAEAATERAAERARAFRDAAAPHGVADPAALDAAIRRADDERGERHRELAAIEDLARRARCLAEDERAARADAARRAQVMRDLDADRFPRHLLTRVLERLADNASERLHTLSGGAYRFAQGGGGKRLDVVDTARGHRPRPASTLSGGERFLASLALALALADVAAGAGGRLDCLFLDEGFSTLDAESLELAMAGVERLADDGRLVGVITHLPGAAERLGASIGVRKDPVSGISTVSA